MKLNSLQNSLTCRHTTLVKRQVPKKRCIIYNQNKQKSHICQNIVKKQTYRKHISKVKKLQLKYEKKKFLKETKIAKIEYLKNSLSNIST